MKNLLFMLMLLITTPVFILAQTNKPTKAQTETYIKQWFDPGKRYFIERPLLENVTLIGINESHIEFTRKYKIVDSGNEYSDIYLIDLSKIEKIEFTLDEIDGVRWRY